MTIIDLDERLLFLYEISSSWSNLSTWHDGSTHCSMEALSSNGCSCSGGAIHLGASLPEKVDSIAPSRRAVFLLLAVLCMHTQICTDSNIYWTVCTNTYIYATYVLIIPLHILFCISTYKYIHICNICINTPSTYFVSYKYLLKLHMYRQRGAWALKKWVAGGKIRRHMDNIFPVIDMNQWLSG